MAFVDESSAINDIGEKPGDAHELALRWGLSFDDTLRRVARLLEKGAIYYASDGRFYVRLARGGEA